MAYAEHGGGMAGYFGRSSGEIQADINERDGWISTLRNINNYVKQYGEKASEISSAFSSAGQKIADAGNVWGQPYDNGKLGSIGGTFGTFSETATEIMGNISTAITEIEDEIADLKIELAAAMAYENRPKPTTQTTPKTEKPSLPKKGACFLKGTKILTINGYINIENINVNDLVLSYNVDLNKNEYKKVLDVFLHKNTKDILYKITSNDLSVEASSKHRFYIKNENGFDWVAIENIKIGDYVVDSNYKYHKICDIKTKNIIENLYNFEVEDNHNYYVTENEILVHNLKVKGI